MTAVSARLVVDVADAVDPMGVLDPSAAAKAVRQPIPAAATVELQVGTTTMCLPAMAPLLRALRPAGSIVVTGTDAAGVADVTARLRTALARVPR